MENRIAVCFELEETEVLDHDYSQDDLDAQRAVEECKHIPYFAYHGEADLGVTWAFTFSVNRDSGRLERSNWEVISEDMIEKFPDDTIIDHCNHWACGWVDHLAVRMIEDNGNATEAGIAILDWQRQLDRYPVADESHFLELEHTENYESAMESIRCDSPYLKVDIPENWKGLIYEWLYENNMDAIEESEQRYDGWLRSKDIAEACEALDYIDHELD